MLFTVSGDYLSLLITLVLLGVPYLILQTYMQHQRYFGKTSWLGYLDFAHAMAGPWRLTWSTAPWLTLLITWALTVICSIAAVAHGDRIDY